MAKSSGLKNACYATGGAVIGKRSEFMKTPDEFREAGNTGATDEVYGKGVGGQAKGGAIPKPTLPKGKSAKVR